MVNVTELRKYLPIGCAVWKFIDIQKKQGMKKRGEKLYQDSLTYF